MTTNKAIITIAAAFLGVVMWVGCSKQGGDAPQQGDRTIRLNAGLQAVSKSAVSSGNSFTAAVGGWESSGEVSYTNAAVWQVQATVAASEAAADIALVPGQYYSQDGSVRTYMKAWYPQGTLVGDGIVSFAGAEHYRDDGTTDVLLAGETSGSALDAAVRTLVFTHPLTQLKFEVECDLLFGATTTIKAITIQDAGIPTGVDLQTDALIYRNGALAVPGIDGQQTISTVKASVGQPVMLRPFAGNSFRINVETSDVTYQDVAVTIDNDAAFVPGKAYTIGLTFAGYAVSAQASVTPWNDTGTGSGDVTTD